AVLATCGRSDDLGQDEAVALVGGSDQVAVRADVEVHDGSSSRSSRAIAIRRSTLLLRWRVRGRRPWSSTSGTRTARSHWERSTGGVSGAGFIGAAGMAPGGGAEE